MSKAKIVDGADEKAKRRNRGAEGPSTNAAGRGAIRRRTAKPTAKADGGGQAKKPAAPKPRTRKSSTARAATTKAATVQAGTTAPDSPRPARKTARKTAAVAPAVRARGAKSQAGNSGSEKARSRKAGRARTAAVPPGGALVEALDRSGPAVVSAPSPAPRATEAPAATVKTVSAGTAVETPGKETTPPPIRGENRLLLLVRDPHTLFATWDMDPSVAAALKARIGSRALAVSTLTIRLTSAGGGTRVVHVSRRAKSRYLKVDGAPSYLAEIGFTTPTGRFEFVARSAPCFVPAAPSGRRPLKDATPPVLGYREARALARRGLLFSSLRQTMKKQSRSAHARSTPASGRQGTTASAKASPSNPAIPSTTPAPVSRPTSLTSRVLGGASDLYRR